MLEDPIGQKYIGQFAKKVMTQVGGARKVFHQTSKFHVALTDYARERVVNQPPELTTKATDVFDVLHAVSGHSAGR